MRTDLWAKGYGTGNQDYLYSNAFSGRTKLEKGCGIAMDAHNGRLLPGCLKVVRSRARRIQQITLLSEDHSWLFTLEEECVKDMIFIKNTRLM